MDGSLWWGYCGKRGGSRRRYFEFLVFKPSAEHHVDGIRLAEIHLRDVHVTLHQAVDLAVLIIQQEPNRQRLELSLHQRHNVQRRRQIGYPVSSNERNKLSVDVGKNQRISDAFIWAP